MEQIVGEDRHPHTSTRQVALARFIGTTVEWYDFFLYGTAAALVFGPLFFSSGDPLTGTLIAFATLVVGFVARPIGGIVLGHFGDRRGRKTIISVHQTDSRLHDRLGGLSLISLAPAYLSPETCQDNRENARSAWVRLGWRCRLVALGVGRSDGRIFVKGELQL